jgi:glycosyltransferase involved in cell wall biosynthesis
MNKNLVITMPVYNEEKNIEKLYTDLKQTFSLDFNCTYIIVNDCSTDTTHSILKKMATDNNSLIIINNDSNQGHGKSTIIGLYKAVSLNPDLVITLDGDGNLYLEDLYLLTKKIIEIDFEIAEGVRIFRDDPIYRKITTFVVSVLVMIKSKTKVSDANTPFRVYKLNSITRMLNYLPKDSIIPNLHISSTSRRYGFRIVEGKIRSRTTKGEIGMGVTWKAKFRNLPSKKFIVFVIKASQEWLKTN